MFFLAISVMFLIRHLLFMWFLVLFCTINAYISLGIYWGSARSIWWTHKAHLFCISLLATLWVTLPFYLAHNESMMHLCMSPVSACGIHDLAQRKWIMYIYSALYFLGIGMMVFAEACRLRMTTYLLIKAQRYEARAAAAESRMMNVNITLGTVEEQQQPTEKDLKEIVIVA
uniref:G_PROTEIN_RECEP_F1_2 domain-containing protein n=1 Tax=Caenorhabditis tropicalis TaxID=1561998 RepID=A0A1I7TNP8_9PELO